MVYDTTGRFAPLTKVMYRYGLRDFRQICTANTTHTHTHTHTHTVSETCKLQPLINHTAAN